MFRLIEISEKIEDVQVIGDLQKQILNIVSLGDREVEESDIFWCSDKNISKLNPKQTGTGIISKSTYSSLKGEINSANSCWVIVENPRRAFMKVMSTFFIENPKWGVIEDSVKIDSTVKINKSNVYVSTNAVIGANVEIGKFVKIGANTVILENTIIGDGVKIGCNCTIGGVGFGYELNEEGEYEVIPHIGNVVLAENVEIGNNVCIDRAVLGSTRLSRNVKVDNLVHIAHGVQIGENSLIIANSMIAGSVVVGKNVWVSPSSSIIQKAVISDDSLIGMGSVVLKNVEESTIVAGVPAKKIKDKK